MFYCLRDLQRTVEGKIRKMSRGFWLILNVEYRMKTWKISPGIDMNGDEGGVWNLSHDRTPYDDDVITL